MSTTAGPLLEGRYSAVKRTDPEGICTREAHAGKASAINKQHKDRETKDMIQPECPQERESAATVTQEKTNASGKDQALPLNKLPGENQVNVRTAT
jgi:hypothetical protein